jgi:phosphatidylglycerophosphatase A
LPPPPRARKKKGPKKPPPPNPAYEGLFKFLSTTFWASYIAPMAPGTVGMIVGLGVWWVLGKLALQPFLHFAILFGLWIFATLVCKFAEPYWGDSESSIMSIDMFAGITIAAAPFRPDYHPKWKTMMAVVVAVYWFLSLLRPPPIDKVQELPHGLGRTMDDLLAAVATIILTWGLYDMVWVRMLGLQAVG